MGDFSTGFGTGFEIGTIIKEKQRAKKILQEVQETLQEWKMSGVEPSYVDKIMMSTLLNQAGSSYATSFANIENDKNAMDREKLSQDALNLRTMNDNGMNLIKMIQTAAKEGTLSLIDWFQVPKEMFPPNFDLNKFLDMDTITKLQDESTKQEALDNIMGVTKELPTEYTMPYMAGQGVPGLEGLQPTTAPKEPTVADRKFDWATEGYQKYLRGEPGGINWNEYKKYMLGTTSENATGLEKSVNDIIAQGNKAGLPQDEINTAVKNKILGTGGGIGETKYRATSLSGQEDYRSKALDANTLEDKNKVVDTYENAGYDPSEMPTDQEWVDSKLEELDSHLEMLKEMTDENGKLQSDKSFKFMSGDEEESKTGLEWYKDVHEAYMFYLDELRKMGVDVSKYPKIKAPAEVSKVGFWKGAFTGGGVERGYQSIYTTPTGTETPKLPSF